jgi:Fur family ferric uptake transcriptional regulator
MWRKTRKSNLFLERFQPAWFDDYMYTNADSRSSAGAYGPTGRRLGTPSPEDVLRSHGLRVTRPRLTVLEILGEGGHLEVDEIAQLVRQRLDSVSTQAVYDVLGALSRAGLARRIEPAGSPARYEGRAGDNHHHIVCRGCGAVADVDCAVGEAPCLDPSTTHGFELDEAEVTFWGLCPSCQARRAED